jgi:hypothetical protein
MTTDLLLKIKLKLISLLVSSLPSRISFLNHDSKELRDEICSFELGFGNKWISMLREIQNEFRNSTIPTSRFLEYKSIQGPLHPNQQYLSSKYIKAIEINSFEFSPVQKNDLLQLLADEQFGSPNCSYLFPQSSTLNIQHVYHLLEIRRHLDVNFESLESIFEFGGGYGNLARLVIKSGFKGRYTIFDFQLMGALQKYYLSRSISTADKINTFKFISNIDDNSLNMVGGNFLFIATWSMSESPIELRKIIFEKILQSANYIYITFQKDWHDVDNFAYFSTLSSRLPRHKCLILPCPIFSENYYFFATIK